MVKFLLSWHARITGSRRNRALGPQPRFGSLSAELKYVMSVPLDRPLLWPQRSIGVGTVKMKKSANSALEIGAIDLAGSVVSGRQFPDPFGINIKSDHRTERARERRGDGQANITKSNDGNLSAVRHKIIFQALPDAVDATSATV